jgi:hypothetical protein
VPLPVGCKPGRAYLPLIRLLIYGRRVLNVMTWDGVVTNFHGRHQNDIGITPTIEAYIQSRVLKTTLEAISSKKRRGLPDGYSGDDEIYKAVERLGTARMGTTEA